MGKRQEKGVLKVFHRSRIGRVTLVVQDLLLRLPHLSARRESHTLVLSVRAGHDDRGPSGCRRLDSSVRRGVGAAAGPERSLRGESDALVLSVRAGGDDVRSWKRSGHGSLASGRVDNDIASWGIRVRSSCGGRGSG
jgi:hypothetical protein